MYIHTEIYIYIYLLQQCPGEAGTSSKLMYSDRPIHMAEQRQDDQLEPTYTDTGCSSEDLPKAMDDREEWRERVRNIHADGVT